MTSHKYSGHSKLKVFHIFLSFSRERRQKKAKTFSKENYPNDQQQIKFLLSVSNIHSSGTDLARSAILD